MVSPYFLKVLLKPGHFDRNYRQNQEQNHVNFDFIMT